MYTHYFEGYAGLGNHELFINIIKFK